MQTLLTVPTTLEPSKYGTSTTINSSSSSIQSLDDQYRKQAIKWLLQFDRKVTKDTNYLAVWYLQILIKNGYQIKQNNWQLISASIILFASKMNQIYPPSITSIIKRIKINKFTQTLQPSAIIQSQCQILNYLQFSIAIQSPYNLIYQILINNKKDIEQCQKLLKIIIYNKDICQNHDSQTISYAIIYLISRNIVDSQLKGEYRQKVKIVAQKMYNFYKDIRKGYEEQKQKQKEKENQGNNINNIKNINNTQNNELIPKPTISINTKQNHLFSLSQQPFSSLCSLKQRQKTSFLLKKASSLTTQTSLHRVSSFKHISNKTNLLTDSTNIQIKQQKQKKIFNCLSNKDCLNYKNIYLYS